MPKISVIVPVYNAEAMLPKCLESIRQQSETDWECILIDDGSPDSSGQICDEYSALDDRFKTFHETNGGVSSARNNGIEMAKGEWIMFIDADDMIASDTLEKTLSEAKKGNLDIIQFSFTRDLSQLGLQDNNETEVCFREEYIAKNKMLCSVWGCLIKSSIIHDNHIRFDERMKLGEDQLFAYTCIANADRIRRIPNILYFYYDNPGSATHNEKIEDIVYSSFQCIDFKRQHPEFTMRMDDVVLFFIEKLLLRREIKISRKILSELQPTMYYLRPWPTRLMASLSKRDVGLGLYIGVVCYTAYHNSMKLLSSIKRQIIK